MRDKQKQVTAFRVQGGSEDRLTAEEFFDRLHKAEHPKKRAGREPLRLQHVFSRCGRSNRFLINLPVKKKLTPQFVEAVAQKELGPGYTATCLDARTNTVKFLPGKRRKTDEKYKSVIEEEASTMAEGDCSARQRFVLVAESERVVYSYDQGKLEKGNPEPRGAHMDFAPPADTAQAILEQRRPGDASCSPRVPAHAPQQAEVPHKSGDSTCWSAANSMAAGTTSRSGGIAAAGADDALPDQPASSDDGAVPGAAGGKRRGPSPDESQATSVKRAKMCQESDTGGAGPSTDEAERPSPVLKQSPQLMTGEEDLGRGAQLNSTSTLKDILSKSAGDAATFVKVVQEVIDVGGVPKFVESLQRDDDPTLQLQSAWVLTKIASGTGKHAQVVIEQGAVPVFVRLIISPNDDICQQAVVALGKIAKSSLAGRDLILEQGAMGYLAYQFTRQLVDRSKLPVLRSATRTLSILCRGKRHPTLQHEHLALSTLAQLLRSDDEEVLSHACRALRFLCSWEYDYFERNEEGDGESDWEEIDVCNEFDVVQRVTLAVIKAPICRSLVELLDHTSPAMQMRALKAVQEIASKWGTSKAIINCGALPRLHHLLSWSESDTRKLTCETIYDLILDNDEWSAQAVIEAKILPTYIQALPGLEDEEKEELLFEAVEKAIRVGTPEQVKDFIPPLLDWLEEKPDDVVMALRFLTDILERGEPKAQVQTGEKEGTSPWWSNQIAAYVLEIGGGDRIEQLQMRDDLNNRDKKKALELLQRYPGVCDRARFDRVRDSLTKSLQVVVGKDSQAPGDQLKSTLTLKGVLSTIAGDIATSAKVFQEVIDAGAVSRFVEFLQRDDDHALQLESAWVLTTIAGGRSDHVQVVVEAGAVPTLVRLVISSTDDICEQAVVALGKIAKSSPVRRDLIVEQGAMGYLIQQLNKQLASRSERSVLISATRTLSILCRGKRHPTLQHESLALPTLAQLLRSDDEEVLLHACRALRFLCSWGYDYFEMNKDGDGESDWEDIDVYNKADVVQRVVLAVIKAPTCRSLVELLGHTSLAVQVQALRTNCIIASYNGGGKAIIGCGALSRLGDLLGSSERETRKLTCETISRLISDDDEGPAQAVIEANILPTYIQALPGVDMTWRASALQLPKAIKVGTPQQVKTFIPPLVDWLEGDLAKTSIDLLTAILEKGETDAAVLTGEKEGTSPLGSNQMAAYVLEIGGGDRIEQLQMRDDLNNRDKKKAQELLHRFPGVLRASEGASYNVVQPPELSGAEHLMLMSKNSIPPLDINFKF